MKRHKIDLKEFDEEEFWGTVSKDGPYIKRLKSRCWEWCGDTFRGYGRYMGHQAHRVSWALTHGNFDEKLNALHKCDNRKCVNPDHIYLGTQGQNLVDMWRRGRRVTNNGVKKHSFDTILKIRELYETDEFSLSELGRIFGMHRSMVYKIVNNLIRTNS